MNLSVLFYETKSKQMKYLKYLAICTMKLDMVKKMLCINNILSKVAELFQLRASADICLTLVDVYRSRVHFLHNVRNSRQFVLLILPSGLEQNLFVHSGSDWEFLQNVLDFKRQKYLQLKWKKTYKLLFLMAPITKKFYL